MGAIKRTLTDHNFYIGIAVGIFVVPRVLGGGKVNVKLPGSN